jgi:DNA-directed RNA polymerase specialized sigma subunit
MASMLRLLLGEDLLSAIARCCTDTQAKYIIRRFQDGDGEEAIAKHYGVSQQAVSKGIAAGLSRLRRELEPLASGF